MDLSIQIATLEKDLAELKRKHEEGKAKRPALAIHQVWRHDDGNHYVVVLVKSEYLLCALQSIDGCGIFSYSGFGDRSNEFTYIGMANDVIRIGKRDKPVVSANEVKTWIEEAGYLSFRSRIDDIRLCMQDFIDQHWKE